MNRVDSVLKMSFAKIYLMYLNKAEKKGRTKEEVDTVIYWLTGHDENSLKEIIVKEVCVGEFFGNFPKLNENAHLITGAICGYRVEEIEDPLMKKMRMLDKLIDELAKGKSVDKILRKA